MLNIENIDLNVILKKQEIDDNDVDLKSSDVMVVPKSRKGRQLLSADDVYIVKKLRGENIKVQILNQDKKEYHEFQGGEFELAMMIVNDFAKPILLGLVSAWIYDIIKQYEKTRKESPESKAKVPKIKVKYYFLKSKKYVEIEGGFDEVTEVIKSLKDDENV